MASTAHCAAESAAAQKRSLARLRKAAGFKKANAFARELGLSQSTYSRYEGGGDGPDGSIPLKAAWRIADALGTTIDAVVGRATEGTCDGRDLNAFYRALSERGRAALDEFVRYLDFRERVLAAEGA